PLYPTLLFFSRDCDHPALHSFPTRRSSDLNASTGAFSIVPVTSGQPIDLGGADASGVLGLTDAELDRITAGTIQVGNLASGTIADRKSTRLNSSHVAISYAVFCLKKKNKIN